MRVLFIAPAGRAGTLQYTHNLANALSDRGHQVALATGVDFELDDYPKRYMVLKTFNRVKVHPGRFLRFVGYLRKNRPEIIHMQGAQHPEIYLGLYYFLRLFSRAKIVYTPQDILSNSAKSYHVWAFRKLYQKVGHIFLNAKHNLETVERSFSMPREKFTVLPMADLTAFVRESVVPVFPRVDPGKKLVLCFGLIEPRKGIMTLINSTPNILAQVGEVEVHIVGKPYMEMDIFHNRIDELGCKNSIVIKDRYVTFEEMSGYFQRADTVVLPYDSGWNSGVLASAIGFGKIVIATKVAGFDEVIEHQVNGMLVAPGNSEELAKTISCVLNDKSLRDSLQPGLAAAATKYSWDAIASDTETVYRKQIT